MTSLSSLWKHPRLRKHVSQMWRFALIGGTGAAVDLTLQHVLVVNAQLSGYSATVCSTLVAATLVFFLNKFITFRSAGKVSREGQKFALVYGVSITTNILITSGLISMGVHYTLAKLIAIAFGVCWNYLMSHGFVFKQKKQDTLEDEVVVM